MSASTTTTWIDMTDLSLWSGHHTGIQRVVYNLALEYAKEANTKFFVYDENNKTFYEIELSSILPPVERPVGITKGRRLREETTSHIRNYYTRLPESWRSTMTPKIKPVVIQLYNSAHHTVYMSKKTFRRASRKEVYRPATFGHGDTVVILGAGWARPTILNELWNRKQTADIRIFHFVHDVIPVFYPHLFGPGHFELFTRYLFDAGQVVDGIVTNSEASKLDTARFLEELLLPKIPIDVIRLGDEIKLSGEPMKPESIGESEQYILAVGTIEIRKNYALLYGVYKLAAMKGIDLPKLVIVGRPGWLAGDTVFAMQHDPEVDGKIVILKDTHDAELEWLYKNCLYSIYPSLYEGWGLPIAEAMVYGKQCLAANISSMPEVAGDLTDYFNPYDAADCLAMMVKYLDADTLHRAESRIKNEYKMQTWHRTYLEFKAAVDRQVADLTR